MLLPSMTGVLTLCFYLKSHIRSVSAHYLLGIRQDRLNINVHLEMIIKTKIVRVKKLSASCSGRASDQLLH